MADFTKIKYINVNDLNTIEECNKAEGAVLDALTKMRNTMDFTMEGGAIAMASLDSKTRKWILSIKASSRYAKTTLRQIITKRDMLYDMADAIERHLVNLIGIEKVEAIKAEARAAFVPTPTN